MYPRPFPVWSHPSVCDEQSFLFVQSFIISITKRRIEDNYIAWTNQSVRRSICHGGRVQYLTGNDWWPGMSVSGQSSLIGCKLLTTDEFDQLFTCLLSCGFFSSVNSPSNSLHICPLEVFEFLLLIYKSSLCIQVGPGWFST